MASENGRLVRVANAGQTSLGSWEDPGAVNAAISDFVLNRCHSSHDFHGAAAQRS